MGYTHYWRQKRDFTIEEWESIGSAAFAIADNQGSIIDLPIFVSDDEIQFNGIGEDAHEDFYLTRIKRDRYPYETDADITEGMFSFCKTARKPYDAAVCAVLAFVETIAPDAISVSSDGDVCDWRPGLDILINLELPAEMPRCFIEES